MPLYCFKVVDDHGNPTGEFVEHICKHADRPEYLTSSDGRTAVYDLASNRIARMTESWAGSAGTWGGINGTFDRGLGQHFSSRKEQDAALESRGLVRESDLGKHFIDDAMEKQERVDAFHSEFSSTYNDNLAKFGGDAVKAATETWSNPSIAQQEREHYGSD